MIAERLITRHADVVDDYAEVCGVAHCIVSLGLCAQLRRGKVGTYCRSMLIEGSEGCITILVIARRASYGSVGRCSEVLAAARSCSQVFAGVRRCSDEVPGHGRLRRRGKFRLRRGIRGSLGKCESVREHSETFESCIDGLSEFRRVQERSMPPAQTDELPRASVPSEVSGRTCWPVRLHHRTQKSAQMCPRVHSGLRQCPEVSATVPNHPRSLHVPA